MSSAILALAEQLTSCLEQAVKDAVKAAMAEQAVQPRYPERVTVQVASEITGYSTHSLYQMSSKNKVPGAHKVGRKLMFYTSALEEWVRSGATPLKG